MPTERGPLLDGVLFQDTIEPANTELVSITDIHGNFYSNPFYVNFGVTFNISVTSAHRNLTHAVVRRQPTSTSLPRKAMP